MIPYLKFKMQYFNYLFFEGEVPPVKVKKSLRILRNNMPPKVKSLIAKLLNPQAAKKINAAEVEKKIKEARKDLSGNRAQNL